MAMAQVMPITADFSQAQKNEHLPAGDATVNKKRNANSFSHSSANMSFKREMNFKLGNALFRKLWIASPSSTQASDGLGPIFNAPSCQRCHLKDGRGHPPTANYPEDNAISMLMRLSITPQNQAHIDALASGQVGAIPEPTYGGQLQDLAVTGHKSEGKIHIEYQEQTIQLAGGEQVSLRHPSYSISNLHYGPLHPQTMMSVRVASPMIGLGLLEAIASADIFSLEDPTDRNNDGISGKANRVWDIELAKTSLGRFGWKAGQPSLNQQSSGAFNGDIGISSPLFKASSGDCTKAQAICIQAPHGNSIQHNNLEIGETAMEFVTFYTRNLAVPQRQNSHNKDVLKGKEIFYTTGCTACHQPSYITSANAEVEQAQQQIWPYTDLLLHDMGEGLADQRPEYLATGSEWRTAPLWGVGLTKTVNKHTFLLHDGRARNTLEAIIWHGGEAAVAQQKVVNMSPQERRLLIQFVESL